MKKCVRATAHYLIRFGIDHKLCMCIWTKYVHMQVTYPGILGGGGEPQVQESPPPPPPRMPLCISFHKVYIYKVKDSIGGFEWIFINLLNSVAFSLQTSEKTSLESQKDIGG